jgi:chromosomal replication initiation ATPase DnaA
MRPRFVAAWLCHTLTSNSYSEIGRQFRKDHSTIMYACHKTRDDAASDPVFGKELLALYDRLEALQEPV